MQRLVAQTLDRHGAIDLFCSNAGIAKNGDETAPDAEWARCWDVHVMAHVYAARAVLPGMLARGAGYLLHTVSAAGLLTHPQSATYAVTKHASLAFAEWLSIAYLPVVQVAAADELIKIVVAGENQPRSAVSRRDTLIVTRCRRTQLARTHNVAIAADSRPCSPRGVPRPVN